MEQRTTQDMAGGLIPYEEARRRAVRFPAASFKQPERFGEHNASGREFDLGLLTDRIDWDPFFRSYGFTESYPGLIYRDEKADLLYEKALETLGSIIAGREFRASLLVNFFNACAEADCICLDKGLRLPMLRQQADLPETLSLCDFVCPRETGTSTAGLFVLRIGERNPQQDDGELRPRLAALLASALQSWIREEFAEGTRILVPHSGSPALPDSRWGRKLAGFLDLEARVGITSLEEEGAAIRYGLILSHPDIREFAVGPVGEDQLESYLSRCLSQATPCRREEGD